MSSSPANESAVNEVPFEGIQIEHMQVQGVCLNAVELAVGSKLRLSLVEITLCTRLAVKLFNLIRVNIEEIAMIRFLVTRREASKDQNVLVGDREKATAFKADPVRILFDLQVQSFPAESCLLEV